MYRLGVGIVLINKHSQVFLGARYDQSEDAWQMPQGGINHGESPGTAAVRELVEETGITSTKYIAETQNWLSYDFPPDYKKMFFCGKYTGQKQKWFLLKFLGTDADITINTPPVEFKKWRWANFMDIVNHAISFKKDMYAEIVHIFTPYLS